MTPPKGITVTQFQMGAPIQPPCPACGTIGYELGGEWFRCPMCGMGFMGPESLKKRIEELNATGYVETPGARAPELDGEREHKIGVVHQIIKGYNAWNGHGDVLEVGKPGRCFEVGFGNGFMMEGAKMCRWTADGCEASQVAVESAQKRMLNTWQSNFDSFPPKLMNQGVYDLIWAWDSFEHMVNLKQAFINALVLLRPGGIFVLHSPDFDKFFQDRNHPHFQDRSHLWHMTPGAMETIKPEELELIKTERHTVWGSAGHAHPDNFVAWFRRKAK